MSRFENQVSAGINKGALSLGVVAPENKNEVLSRLGETMDNGISKEFPAFILMRAGLVRPDSECGIQEEDALLGPVFKISRARRLPAGRQVFAQIGPYLFVDIDQ